MSVILDSQGREHHVRFRWTRANLERELSPERFQRVMGRLPTWFVQTMPRSSLRFWLALAAWPAVLAALMLMFPSPAHSALLPLVLVLLSLSPLWSARRFRHRDLLRAAPVDLP